MRLKLVCSSCDYTELVSDPRIDECPYCKSDKIEIVSIPETFPRSKVEGPIVKQSLKPLLCKKCGKEVIPIKEQKTAGKRAANFFAFFLGGGAVYTYPKRCPYCNKILRTKTQKTVGIICLIIYITIVIIGVSLTVIPKYF